MARQESLPDKELPGIEVSAGVRIGGLILRALFLIALMAATIRVSLPQSETIWTAYDTPSDLVRMILGLGLCIFLGVQLFKRPVDAAGYRAWLYLGPVALPFAVICLIYTW